MFGDSPQTKTPNSLMLPGFWYRAPPADTVFRERLERATLLETPLVIGRDAQNRPFALKMRARIAACRFLAEGLTAIKWVQLPRLAVRRALRPVPINSVADL